MRKTFTSFLFLLLFISSTYAQIDRNGNPVFNSISLEEQKVHDFTVSANYYTLKNNLENQQSSVFVSTKPTLDQILKAATTLPANFYILSKDKRMQYMVLLLPSQEGNKAYSFLLLNPTTGEKQALPTKLKGDITESRANELLTNNYDQKAQLDKSGKFLLFNNTSLTIIQKEEIDKQVAKIAKNLKSDKAADSEVGFLNKVELEQFIRKETSKYGKLDYWTKLNVDKEKAVGIQVDGFFMQKQHAAVYLWGKSVAELGVETLEEAKELLIAIRGEQNKMEVMHLESGFNKGSGKN